MSEKGLKFVELEKHIQSLKEGASAASMYIVAGEDDYLKSRSLALFRTLIDEDYRDFNLSVVSVSAGMSAVLDALYTFPVFDERKIVIIPDLNEKPSDTERAVLEKYISEPCSGAILIAVCDKDVSGAFAKSSSVILVDCGRLDDSALAVEIEKLLALTPQRTADSAAVRELISRTLGSMSRIAGELNKLKAYCTRQITKSDVEELVAPDTDYQIYELSGAVSERDSNRALRVLDVFFKNGVKPMTVLGLLYGQYRKMLHTELHKNESDAEIAKLLGIKPAAVYHTKKVSKNYSQLRLKKSVDYLHSLQYDVLCGKRTETGALHEAVLELLNI